MLSREELIKRGARKKDGSLLVKPEEQPVPEPTPLVGEVKIDTAPIADVFTQLSDVVKAALDAQVPVLKQIAEGQSQPVEVSKPPVEWEFSIVRDARGRIETIKAKAI